MSQHTNCHGNAEEREAELAPELHPRHRPCRHERLLLGTCPAARWPDGQARSCRSPHPTQLVERDLVQLHKPPLRAASPGEVTDLFICLKNAH